MIVGDSCDSGGARTEVSVLLLQKKLSFESKNAKGNGFFVNFAFLGTSKYFYYQIC